MTLAFQPYYDSSRGGAATHIVRNAQQGAVRCCLGKGLGGYCNVLRTPNNHNGFRPDASRQLNVEESVSTHKVALLQPPAQRLDEAQKSTETTCGAVWTRASFAHDSSHGVWHADHPPLAQGMGYSSGQKKLVSGVADEDELAVPAHCIVLGMTSRDECSELSTSTMIPPTTTEVDLVT